MTKMVNPQVISVRSEQIRTFLACHQFNEATLHPLHGDASFRRYIRIHQGNHVAMLMDAPPGKEDVSPYITIANHLMERGYSAPRILAQDIAAGLLLLEDLGDDSFTSVLKKDNNKEKELYTAAIDVLAEWHISSENFASPTTLHVPLYDKTLLLQEVSLFADWFLPQILGREGAKSLRQEYMALWKGILDITPLTTRLWVHRDYHADNLMWLPKRDGTKRVGLLDFQDGVYGDAAYDMVSLLEDARRDVPSFLAEEMLRRYIAATGVDESYFRTAYAVLGAQRNSKIVGIFTRLAVRDGKLGYLNYLPRVWQHLEHDIKHPALAPLKRWIDRYIKPEYRGSITLTQTLEQL